MPRYSINNHATCQISIMSPTYVPGRMLPLAFVFLNECICLTMLLPFVGYMVVDFKIVETKDQAVCALVCVCW